MATRVSSMKQWQTNPDSNVNQNVPTQPKPQPGTGGGYSGGGGKVIPTPPKPIVKREIAYISPGTKFIQSGDKILTFNISSKSGSLGICRVEIEFYTDKNYDRPFNIMAERIIKDSSDFFSVEHPRGSIKEYEFKKVSNIESDDVNNFTITVKDWNEAENMSSYTANVCVPSYIINDENYHGKIYMVTKKSNTITRKCIGDL